MTIKETLQKALEMLGPNGENWQNHQPDIEKFCALTAINKAGRNGNQEEARQHFLSVIGSNQIGTWNDKQTWPQVKAAFEAAIMEAGQ
jgi:hypothetical protein